MIATERAVKAVDTHPVAACGGVEETFADATVGVVRDWVRRLRALPASRRRTGR